MNFNVMVFEEISAHLNIDMHRNDIIMNESARVKASSKALSSFLLLFEHLLNLFQQHQVRL